MSLELPEATTKRAPGVLSSERYRFGSILGHGGMATVYRAFDTVSEREVAIKVLHAQYREHPVLVAHFRQEFAIAKMLEHPNIVRIDNLIDTPEMLALVMELHGTHDLKQHVQRHGPLDYQQVEVIARQLFSALEAAHARQIVHQDIKPHNVLWYDTMQTAKLIDFGLAMLDKSIALARPEIAMGTVEYSAPEQFDEFGVDARADLYSLGVTLFELLSGSLPYRAATSAGVIQMHQDAPVADVRVFVRAVPARIAETLLRAMAKAPEDRFGSAAEMREAFFGTGGTLAKWPVSPDWEQYKERYRERKLVSMGQRWHVYLPARSRPYDPAQREALVGLFQKYRDYYRGPLVDGLPAFLSEKEDDPATQEAVLLASGLAFFYAERIRQKLGKVGIYVEEIGWNQNITTLRTRWLWGWLQWLRRVPRILHGPVLALLAMASYAVIMHARAIGSPELMGAVLWVWTGVFLRICFSMGLHKTAPEEAGIHKHLLHADKYLFQFSAPVDGAIGCVAAEGLLHDRHVFTYWQLRSKRMQASYDRVVATLLDGFSEEGYRARAASILDQATHLAERIIQLEKQLADQNYPTLFSQLASLDAQIARSGDTDQTAELIEQKTALRRQLDTIDDDREALITLGQELVSISQQLHASWCASETDFGVAF